MKKPRNALELARLEATYLPQGIAINGKSAPPIKSNPITLEIVKGLNGGHSTWPKGSEMSRECFTRSFGAETVTELGWMLVDALTSGDKSFPKVVEQALKDADFVFNRSRVQSLIERVVVWAVNNPIFNREYGLDGPPLPTVKEVRELISKELNNGRAISDADWKRIRAQMKWDNLPQGKPGAPKRK